MLRDCPLYAYIPATDVGRARRFYEETLDFDPLRETAGGVVYGFREGTACFLYPTANAGTSRASQAFWLVDDIDREIDELERRGVRFEQYDMPGDRTPNGAIVAGGAKAAWFKDTEGNILAIIESLSKDTRIDTVIKGAQPASTAGPLRVRAVAARAAATGALAIGALAIGALAIGRLAIGRARIGKLQIDDLVVGRVRSSSDT